MDSAFLAAGVRTTHRQHSTPRREMDAAEVWHSVASDDDGTLQLRLLGGVAVVADGETIAIPGASARVLAYVALLAPSPVDRRKLAGELWPETTDRKAGANLRSALYRLRDRCPDLLEVTSRNVRLQPHVWLDIDHPVDAWWSLGGDQQLPRTIPSLLPGWYDDWVVHERERVRQTVLHDLEAAAKAFLSVDAFATAIDLALQAATCEPLRETPRRLAIEAYLGEGNVADAVREFQRFAETLRTELGIGPSPDLAKIIEVATNS